MQEQLHLSKQYKGIKLYKGAKKSIILVGRDVLKEGVPLECEAEYNRVINKIKGS